MSTCIVCQQEELPNPAAEPINTQWVCVCGADYRLVSLPDQGQQWAHLGQASASVPDALILPGDLISKAELEQALIEYQRDFGVPATAKLADLLRDRFNIPPATELIEVVLHVEIPVPLTTASLAERVSEHLATLTPSTINKAMQTAQRVK